MSTATTTEALLSVEGLKKYFPIRAGLFGRVKNHVKAVDGVSFEVRPGETLGLVGESGCGKTTVGRSILRLIEPTAGTVRFKSNDLATISGYELRQLRREMQIIFQDPYSSLNPRMTVEGIVGEALSVHGISRGADLRRRVAGLLERCGLSAKHMGRYPHEFSGGQRQRVGIARALALEPSFIVCDEAVSALDVSIQAQVINLLMDIQRDMGISYLFIAHDLSVVEHISDRVAVMYLGRIVEIADAATIYAEPMHPYTRALLSAVPVPDPEANRARIILEGDVPTPIDPPSGCPFHTRCWLAEERCRMEVPALRDLGGGHQSACHLVDVASTAIVKEGLVVPIRAGKDWKHEPLPVIDVEPVADPKPEPKAAAEPKPELEPPATPLPDLGPARDPEPGSTSEPELNTVSPPGSTSEPEIDALSPPGSTSEPAAEGSDD